MTLSQIKYVLLNEFYYQTMNVFDELLRKEYILSLQFIQVNIRYDSFHTNGQDTQNKLGSHFRSAGMQSQIVRPHNAPYFSFHL